MRKLVTEEEKQIWAERYLNRETCRSISKDFPQYNENTISKHIRKLGLSLGKGKIQTKEKLKPIILEEYVTDKYATCSSLGRKYKISDRTISSWLKDNGIEIKQKQGFLTHCNTDYFEQIDTPDKAYLLGFITADGAVVNSCCSLEVKDDDIEIIKFAQKQINPEATITYCNYGKKHNVRIAFNSKKLCNDLAKYGVIQNKSKTIKEVPKALIPKNLLCFYFRGLIDGDGCIHKKGGLSIYSGSENFIKSVQETIVAETGVKKLGIYCGTTYFITWTSKEDRKKLFNYLYGDLNATFYYERKYKRMYNSLYDNTEVTN